MREGFDEMVEEYISFFADESGEYPDELEELVLTEMQATYKLTQEEISYIKMKCRYV